MDTSGRECPWRKGFSGWDVDGCGRRWAKMWRCCQSNANLSPQELRLEGARRAPTDIDHIVQTAVAENSLNPASVEAAIRKVVLPRLFSLTGLDLARAITDQVVEVTRAGLSRDAA